MGRRAARVWVAGLLLPLTACTLTVDVETDDDGLGIHGNGIITTGSRDVAGYDRVSAVVIIGRNAREGIRVTTDENLLPWFETTGRLSGAARLEISGDVDRLTLTLSGASTFDGRATEARSAHPAVSGACAAIVRVTCRLVAWASGVASIRYIGDPVFEIHVSGTAWIGRYQEAT